MRPSEGDLRDLESVLHCQFRDRQLLRRAVTHRSYVHEHPEVSGETNERLEFLGDSILHFMIADELYRRNPEAPEGQLTALRAAIVRTESLTQIAEALDLASYLRVSRGEATIDGRGRQSILADALEAVLAAVYLDAGWETAQRLVRRLFASRLADDAARAGSLNVKGRLQEIIQAEGGGTPTYRVVSRNGPVHAEQFEVEVVAGDRVLGRGLGIGKRQAEHDAARNALGQLDVRIAEPSAAPVA